MKPGGHDLAGDVEVEAAGRQGWSYRRHPVIADRDVAHGVKAGFRGDDPAAPQDYVELSHR